MSGRKQEISRKSSARLAAEIAGSEDSPLDVLLRMLRDPAISSSDRVEIAKICLPFVHPRIAPLHPSEIEPQQEQPDICDPSYVLSLIRQLAFSLASSRHRGQQVPSQVWDLIKFIPRGPGDLKPSPSAKVSGSVEAAIRELRESYNHRE